MCASTAQDSRSIMASGNDHLQPRCSLAGEFAKNMRGELLNHRQRETPWLLVPSCLHDCCFLMFGSDCSVKDPFVYGERSQVNVDVKSLLVSWGPDHDMKDLNPTCGLALNCSTWKSRPIFSSCWTDPVPSFDN